MEEGGERERRGRRRGKGGGREGRERKGQGVSGGREWREEEGEGGTKEKIQGSHSSCYKLTAS